MAKSSHASQVATLGLPAVISAEVEGWRSQGYHPFPSETTRQLLRHWFDREHDEGGQFHECQRLGIETIIYLHEIRGVKILKDVYEQFAPERLNLFQSIATEVKAIPFSKYCIKAATGSGKTWVLNALIVWQYFNALNGETNAAYSPRFMIVTPGLEVRNRILDSFKGRRDQKTGNRDPNNRDMSMPLFMPQDADWRGRFQLEVLEPDDIRSNTQPPDGPFVAITNWQQFALGKDEVSLAEQMGLTLPDEPQGEIVADFMTTFPDLVVLNDEAHHVHGKASAKSEELVWRRFMRILYDRMAVRHGKDRGLFLQLDFSATPFYGSGKSREYFPQIVYDYDLRDALNDMLVKQLFLEERVQPKGAKALRDLDFKAIRDADGAVLKLSAGQKQIVEIGLSKLNQLTGDFVSKGLNRKPVLMILCEDTEVADRVHEHLQICKDFEGNALTDRNLLLFHSNLKKDKHGYTMDEARGGKGPTPHPTLDGIDDDADPLRVVISVLALREGFDKTNICVTAVLRATEADMLLEQIVGRGLRLMFPGYKYPELAEAKRQAFEDLKQGNAPQNSLDFLYIVEHPRFRTFYDDLKKQGYLIATGDSSTTTATGDLIPVEAMPARIPKRDIAWPVTVQEESKLPDLATVNVDALPSGTLSFDQAKHALTTFAVTDRHLETDTRASTWTLKNKYFDYEEFLRDVAHAVAGKGAKRSLSGKLAEIAALADDYTTRRLFAKEVDFRDPENYVVLAYGPIRDHVTAVITSAVRDLLGTPTYEVRTGVWRRLSNLTKVFVRENHAIPTLHCIYPSMPVSARFGGLEKQVMVRTLDKSPEVLAWCKLQRKHGLTIAYRDPSGLLRNYEVDFILRTADSCFLLETKADKDLNNETVAIKARAAKHWCESVSGVKAPLDLSQGEKWEYLLLDESTYRANSGASFTALLPLMRQVRDQVIAQQFHGALFG